MTRQFLPGAIAFINLFHLHALLCSYCWAEPEKKPHRPTAQEFRKKIEDEQVRRIQILDQEVRAASAISEKDKVLMTRWRPFTDDDLKQENKLMDAEMKAVKGKQQIETPKGRKTQASKTQELTPTPGRETIEKPAKTPKASPPSQEPAKKVTPGEGLPVITF
jgi:hypothetical protein